MRKREERQRKERSAKLLEGKHLCLTAALLNEVVERSRPIHIKLAPPTQLMLGAAFCFIDHHGGLAVDLNFVLTLIPTSHSV